MSTFPFYLLFLFLNDAFFCLSLFAVGRLPQLYAGNPTVASAAAAANVRNCNCCPYGYHIDLDFVRYCESLANAQPSEEELQRRSRRRSRKSMEFMLGLDAMFEQWDAAARVQAVPEVSE